MSEQGCGRDGEAAGEPLRGDDSGVNIPDGCVEVVSVVGILVRTRQTRTFVESSMPAAFFAVFKKST